MLEAEFCSDRWRMSILTGGSDHFTVESGGPAVFLADWANFNRIRGGQVNPHALRYPFGT